MYKYNNNGNHSFICLKRLKVGVIETVRVQIHFIYYINQHVNLIFFNNIIDLYIKK